MTSLSPVSMPDTTRTHPGSSSQKPEPVRGREPVIVIWTGFSLAAIGLASFAPAWTAACCVPLAGLVTWVAVHRRRRLDRQRLDRLADSLGRSALPPRTESAGASVHAATAIRPIAHDRGDPISALSALIEVRGDALRDAERRHDEEISSLVARLDAVDTPVIATDESGRVASMNRAAEQLFETGPRRSPGTPLDNLFASAGLLDLHARAARGEACRGRMRITLAGQARIHEVSAVPVRPDTDDENNSDPANQTERLGVVLTLRDVHELAQTLRLRTDFAANASHELRTPIASIRAAIETLGGHAADDPEMQKRLLGMIENNTARLEEMVDDLLDLSRLESDERPIKTDSFRGDELAETLASMFAGTGEARGVTLELAFDPALANMRTDRKLVMLVLRNLVDNAIKFAFENTAVRVTAEVIPGKAGSLNGARFRVADRGAGIPLKHQQRVFERFFQVDESRTRLDGRRGSGLGLAIVRHALRRLEGSIDVDSVWREGTTMTVEIPGCVLPGSAGLSPPEAKNLGPGAS